MMDRSTWIDLLLGGVDMFSNPTEEFTKYEYSTLIKCYTNYLEYASVFLYEDAFFEDFIKESIAIFPKSSYFKKNLEILHNKIDRFYEKCKTLDDFTLIRRPEWEEIIPLAKECSDELQKILAEEQSKPKE